jgi:hypothetical protein
MADPKQNNNTRIRVGSQPAGFGCLIIGRFLGGNYIRAGGYREFIELIMSDVI